MWSGVDRQKENQGYKENTEIETLCVCLMSKINWGSTINMLLQRTVIWYQLRFEMENHKKKKELKKDYAIKQVKHRESHSDCSQ